MSTAASIPDYRGPQGIWTLHKKGAHNASSSARAEMMGKAFVEALPTLSHMALLQWLHDERPCGWQPSGAEHDRGHALFTAAKAGQLPVVKWLCSSTQKRTRAQSLTQLHNARVPDKLRKCQ